MPQKQTAITLALTAGIIIIAMTPFTAIGSNSKFFDEDGNVLYKDDRPAINEDFAPDDSCLFDVFQLKCIPGSAQKCPRPQFGSNEDNTCWPKTFINGEWVRNCPKDYHTTDGDETGQCYPNSSGCYEASLVSEDRKHKFPFILLTGNESANPYDACADVRDLCELKPDHQGCTEFREWKSKYYN